MPSKEKVTTVFPFINEASNIGLTKRELLVSMIAQAIVNGYASRGKEVTEKELVRMSINLADALLEAL